MPALHPELPVLPDYHHLPGLHKWVLRQLRISLLGLRGSLQPVQWDECQLYCLPGGFFSLPRPMREVLRQSDKLRGM